MAALITVRALSPSYEPQMGAGQACLISDLYAVAQIIGQRLRLFQGEWWENSTLGLPLFQSILGQGAGNRALQVMMMVILQQIATCPYVQSIASSSYSYDANARIFTFQCVVLTQFGAIVVTNTPNPTAQAGN